jgi:hypothetical protein
LFIIYLFIYLFYFHYFKTDSSSNESRIDLAELTVEKEFFFFDQDHNPTGKIDLKKATLDISRQQHLMFQFRHNVNGKDETSKLF